MSEQNEWEPHQMIEMLYFALQISRKSNTPVVIVENDTKQLESFPKTTEIKNNKQKTHTVYPTGYIESHLSGDEWI